jgi:hypothetical protein
VKRTIGVYLGEQARRIGTLDFAAEGNRQAAMFSYDVDWLASKDMFALEPGLPLVQASSYTILGRTHPPQSFSVASPTPNPTVGANK